MRKRVARPRGAGRGVNSPATAGTELRHASLWRMMTPVRGDLPSGTVTFLFTDVEGSTKLLHELGAEAYARLWPSTAGDPRGLRARAASRWTRKATRSSSPSPLRRAHLPPRRRCTRRWHRADPASGSACTRARRSLPRRGTSAAMSTGPPGSPPQATAARCSFVADRDARRGRARGPRRAPAEGPLGPRAHLPTRRTATSQRSKSLYRTNLPDPVDAVSREERRSSQRSPRS